MLVYQIELTTVLYVKNNWLLYFLMTDILGLPYIQLSYWFCSFYPMLISSKLQLLLFYGSQCFPKLLILILFLVTFASLSYRYVSSVAFANLLNPV